MYELADGHWFRTTGALGLPPVGPTCGACTGCQANGPRSPDAAGGLVARNHPAPRRRTARRPGSTPRSGGRS
jgi:hypothetical protein